MADLFVRFERFLMRWTLRAAMALLVLTCFVSFYQVITRFVFEEPSAWSEVADQTWRRRVVIGFPEALRADFRLRKSRAARAGPERRRARAGSARRRARAPR